jgi:hypothetical protein
MADKFNPWHTWLGIPAEEQPADHYRLLGIQQLEDNPTVIENAADQRMMLLRSFQTGKHSDLSQTLLNEVAAARVCLLNPEKKAAYDRDLLSKRQAAAQAKAAPASPAEALPQIHVEPARPHTKQPAKPVSPGSEPAPPAPSVNWAVAGGGVALFLLIGTTIGVVLALRSGPRDQVAAETGGSSPKAERPSGGPPNRVAPKPTAKSQPCLVLQWPAAERQDARLEIDDFSLDLATAQDPQHPGELRFPVVPGQHTVRILRRGFEPFWQTVLIEQGQDAQVAPVWKANKVAVIRPPDAKPPEPNPRPPAQVPEQPATEMKPGPEDATASAQKVNPPSADEQKDLLRAIDEVYKPADAKDQAARLALSRRLLADGRKHQANRSEQFVLLRRAGEIARDAGEPELMLETVDAMTAAGFNVQPFQLKARLLGQLVEQGSSGGAGQLAAVVAACVSFVEEAAASGAMDEAGSVLATARSAAAEQGKQAQNALRAARVAAGRARNPADKTAQEKKAAAAQTELEAADAAKSALADCAGMLQQLEREHKTFQAAQERLKTEPDNAEANLAAGEFLCFVQGDWAQGLPHLSKGANAELKALADQEVSVPPTDSADQVTLADRWWDLALLAKRRKRDLLLLHAGAWYQLAAQGELTGLSKSRVETRLGDIRKLGRPLFVAARIPLPKIVFGKWFPLLTSPDELVGWEEVENGVRYRNRTLETQKVRIVYPVVTRDVSIRAKAKKVAGQNIGLNLRKSDKGYYGAWFNGGSRFGIGKSADGKWSDLKSGNSPQACDGFFEFGFSAIGDTLTLFVNGQPVVQTRDTSHTEGIVQVGGVGSGVFTDIELFIPSKESLVADNRKLPTKPTEPRK